MSFRIETVSRMFPTGLQSILLMSDADGLVGAEVLPGLGGNVLRWFVDQAGRRLDLLYVTPDFDRNPVPTRSGNPVLYPFANRIRDGRYSWNGRDYQLALNCPTKRNAIHGWACRNPWRILSESANRAGATVVLGFRASLDAPETLSLWPSDYGIEMTIHLSLAALRLSAILINHGEVPMPTTFGYHPYFSTPFTNEAASIRCTLQSPAEKMWELDQSLPTGRVVEIPESKDIRRPKGIAELDLDDLLTEIPRMNELMCCFGRVSQEEVGSVEIWCDAGFREAVVYTPPHRQAVCIEPYSGITDAVNMQSSGCDAGLTVLGPGERKAFIVEYRFRAK